MSGELYMESVASMRALAGGGGSDEAGAGESGAGQCGDRRSAGGSGCDAAELAGIRRRLAAGGYASERVLHEVARRVVQSGVLDESEQVEVWPCSSRAPGGVSLGGGAGSRLLRGAVAGAES